MKYQIDDAQHRAAMNPEFERPLPEEIDMHLKPGVFVKLVFQYSDGEQNHGERMWVRVTEGRAGVWTGELSNDPVSIPPDVLDLGDIVRFEPRHVADIEEG